MPKSDEMMFKRPGYVSDRDLKLVQNWQEAKGAIDNRATMHGRKNWENANTLNIVVAST